MPDALKSQIKKYSGFLLALPGTLWVLIFFIAPLFIILGISFLTRTSSGVGTLPLTLTHYERSFSFFGHVIWRSVWIAFVTTLICLVASYPLAFYIRSRKSPFVQNFALFLVMLPFWTNFLVRTYSWQAILSRNGVLNGFLMNLGIVDEPLQMLNTEFALLIGLTYGFLPYMTLPIYVSLRRFDFKMIEASQDLGANDWKTFWHVVLPMTIPGVVVGCILVFVPAIGDFVVANMMGGNRGLMIGNLVQNQYRGIGNMPLGSALSVILMIPVLIAIVIYARMDERGENI